MRAITMLSMLDITITNIPIIMGIMGVMAMVITRPLGLATVTAEVIMAVILHMDGIMEVFMVAIEGTTAEAIVVAGGTVVIDKTGNIFLESVRISV
jgi:hypothetical protein